MFLARCRLTAVVLLLAVAACGRRAEAPPEPSTITLAIRADVTGFFPNPPIVSESFTISINRSIFESLMRLDPQFHLQPELAERWENPDDHTYRFELRPGLRFSDGRPLRAADVAASLQAITRHGWITRDQFQAIESARAVDDRRLEVRTWTPYGVLLHRLTWGFVLPAAVVDKSPVPIIGTGPYRLESWTPGREFVLSRNTYHGGPAPAFDRARFVVVADDAERIGRVRRGQADVADEVPMGALAALQQAPDVRVLVRPSLRVLFLCLRPDRPPFSDPRVRQAIDLALDRRELVRRALAGRAEPASQLVPPAIVGHNPNIPITRADRRRARALLSAARISTGPSLRLDGTHNRYADDRKILEEVARQLGEAGIRVEVNALDKRDFFDLVDRGRSSFYLLGWACESGDAGEILDALLHSPTGGPLGSYNTLGLADPTLDRLIEASNRAVTRVRPARLQAALARAAELRVTLPLAIPVEAVALSPRIEWDPPVSLALRPADMRLRKPEAR